MAIRYFLHVIFGDFKSILKFGRLDLIKFQNFHIVISERNEIIDGGLGNTTNTTMIMVFLATTVFDWRKKQSFGKIVVFESSHLSNMVA